MAGRRDDGTRDRLPASAAHPGPPAARPRTLHTVGLVVGLLLAVGATAAVLVTDDAGHLRMALLAACWAFLVAAFLAGGRRADRLAAESREAELRHTYEVELEREVAARAAYELQLEQRLRREAEEGMRRELAQLRRELTGFADLRGDLAALGQFRGELAGLGELRADLGRLRSELSDQLSGGLLIESMVMRAQAVRLPAEASADDGRTLDGATPAGSPTSGTWEQRATVERRPGSREAPLSGSLPGSGAMPAAVVPAAGPPGGPATEKPGIVEAPRPLDGPGTGVPGLRRTPPPPIGSTRRWARVDDELAPGGEDARRPADGSGPPGPRETPTWQPPGAPSWTSSWTSSESERPWTPPPTEPSSPEPSSVPGRPGPAPRSRDRVGPEAAPAEQGDVAAPRRHRRAAEPDGEHRATGSTPAAAADPGTSRPPAPVPVAAVGAPEDRWWESPAWSGSSGEDRAVRHQVPAAPAPGPAPSGEPVAGLPAGGAGGHARLEQILAESGVSPAPGRRRRRYRDDDGSQPADDVLARVLGNAPPV